MTANRKIYPIIALFSYRELVIKPKTFFFSYNHAIEHLI